MKGTRLPDGTEWSSVLACGAFWKDASQRWMVVCPNGVPVDVSTWQVEQHSDGTITVSPSILVYGHAGVTYDDPERQRLVESHGEEQVQTWERGRPSWHGFLEHGVWREV
jgi:hypothetical protein